MEKTLTFVKGGQPIKIFFPFGGGIPWRLPIGVYLTCVGFAALWRINFEIDSRLTQIDRAKIKRYIPQSKQHIYPSCSETYMQPPEDIYPRKK